MEDTNIPTKQDVDLTPFREQYSYYARRLLSDLGLGELQQPERGQLLAAIETYVQQVLVNTLLENLDGADVDEAEQILDSDGEEAVIGYLVANVPDIEIKMADALAGAYARMLEETKQLAAAITDGQEKGVSSMNQEADKETTDYPTSSRLREANSLPTTESTPPPMNDNPAPDELPNVPSGIDENPTPNSSTDSDGNEAAITPLNDQSQNVADLPPSQEESSAV